MAGFADRWMLQQWGGAAEQAFYAVASQFASIALLATSSVIRIFWKEIAEAHHRSDRARVEWLYTKASRGLYFIGAVFAGGLLPWTEEIIQLTLGAAYAGGVTTLMIMFLYPVHQSLGQIGGTMFYATGHTRIYTINGAVTLAVSLVIAYIILAPTDAVIPGLALASQGLAWKMLGVQFLAVNIQNYILARVFKWKFDWQYQVVAIAVTISVGWFVKIMVTGIVAAHISVALTVAGSLYFVLILAVLFLMPFVAGIEREELHHALNRLKSAF